MVEIKVCVGSSCHMKGSYQVIKTFDELCRSNGLEDRVKLKASFCLGCCLDGIAVMVGETPITGVGFSNAEQVFFEKVYPILKAELGEAEPSEVEQGE